MRNFGHMEGGRIGSLTDYRLWKRILALDRSMGRALWLAICLSLLVTGATLSLPLLLKSGIDRFMLARDLPLAQRLQGLDRVALVSVFLVVLIFLVSLVQSVLLEWLAQGIMHRLRQRLFRHLLDLDIAFFQEQPLGRLVTRLTNDIQNMHEMFTSVIVTLFNDLLRLAGVLVLLVAINPILGGLMCGYLPLVLFTTHVFSRLARDRFRALRRRLSRLNGFMQEMLSGLETVQILGADREVVQTYKRLSSGYTRRALAQVRLFAFFMPLTEFMAATATALIVWQGGSRVLAGQLSPGELVAFLSYMRLFFQPLRELSQKYSIVQSALASAERIFQTLDRKSRLEVVTPIHEPKQVQGRMRLERVSFSYRKGKEKVLREISMELEPGTVTALVGRTGSGKSTLASLLVRLYDPDQGRVLLDGVDIRHYPLDRLRCHVGMIMQDVLLLPATVRENITAGSTVGRDALDRLLDRTGLDRLLARLPHGLETRIGAGGRDLSVGERQLLGFVRILARNPAVLVFDEATSSLDSAGEAVLDNVLRLACGDRTVLIIAHRLSTVRRADRILVMEKGRIVEAGCHEELLEREGIYAGLVATDLAASRKKAKEGDASFGDKHQETGGR